MGTIFQLKNPIFNFLAKATASYCVCCQHLSRYLIGKRYPMHGSQIREATQDMKKHPSSLAVLAEIFVGTGRNFSYGSHCFERISVESKMK